MQCVPAAWLHVAPSASVPQLPQEASGLHCQGTRGQHLKEKWPPNPVYDEVQNTGRAMKITYLEEVGKSGDHGMPPC